MRKITLPYLRECTAELRRSTGGTPPGAEMIIPLDDFHRLYAAGLRAVDGVVIGGNRKLLAGQVYFRYP